MTVRYFEFAQRGPARPFNELPPGSIALDGYCAGPLIDNDLRRYSFDHHEGCLRLITRATCQQVLDALLLGFDPQDSIVYINDADGDTILSLWLLLHPDRVLEPAIRRLIENVGMRDAHGTSYPIEDPDLVEHFTCAVAEPLYGDTTPLPDQLQASLARLDAFIAADCSAPPSSDSKRSFVITHQGLNWVMVRSDHDIFDLLYAAGYQRMIVYQPLSDGSIKYTVAKKSDFISDFPVGPGSQPGTLLNMLEQHEPGWGGASTIGGAPRHPDGSRSRLTPGRVFELVEAHLQLLRLKSADPSTCL